MSGGARKTVQPTLRSDFQGKKKAAGNAPGNTKRPMIRCPFLATIAIEAAFGVSDLDDLANPGLSVSSISIGGAVLLADCGGAR
jgi:hypothetical protein